MVKNVKRVKTVKALQKELEEVESYWSRESLVRTKALVLIAEQLDELLKEIKEIKRQKPQKKKVSAYNVFFGKKIQEGHTAAEAAELWKAEKIAKAKGEPEV